MGKKPLNRKGKAKAKKLMLKKETIKDLDSNDTAGVKGGVTGSGKKYRPTFQCTIPPNTTVSTQ